uniref:EamA domain-containing protein n=1 Tax=Pyrodinium bahamense TaxID=73915 RepID=A0A7S0B0X5_9DINO|mmetsp:Transcript_46377/g.129032  ORF Transcript_46377/g.129032 Transcript_46377/m.129032 type:complete len:493 (+) Transcript_46377:73-1551(+)
MNLLPFLYAGGLLLASLANTVNTKLLWSLRSEGVNGEVELFNKPFLSLTLMNVAMFMAGWPGLLPICRKAMAKRSGDYEGSAEPSPRRGHFGWVVLGAAGVAFLDFTGVALYLYGYTFTPASTYEVMRAALVFFTAILLRVIFGTTLRRGQLLGLLCIGLGMAAAGGSNMIETAVWGSKKTDGPERTAGEVAVGCGLIVLGVFSIACMLVAQAKVVDALGVDFVILTGLMGAWLCVYQCVLWPVLAVVPGPDNGAAQDPYDTIVKVQNNPVIAAIGGLYLASATFYQYFLFAINAKLSPLHSVLAESMRPFCAWAISLFVYYAIDKELPLAEGLSLFSIMKFAGCILTVTGQLLFFELFACCRPKEVEVTDDELAIDRSTSLGTSGTASHTNAPSTLGTASQQGTSSSGTARAEGDGVMPVHLPHGQRLSALTAHSAAYSSTASPTIRTRATPLGRASYLSNATSLSKATWASNTSTSAQLVHGLVATRGSM